MGEKLHGYCGVLTSIGGLIDLGDIIVDMSIAQYRVANMFLNH